MQARVIYAFAEGQTIKVIIPTRTLRGLWLHQNGCEALCVI